MKSRPGRRAVTHRLSLLLLLAALWTATSCSAQTTPSQRLRIVGGLAGVSQYTQHEQQFWTRDLTRLSDGKYSASIVPFDQAGVPGQEMLNLMKLGVVPFGTALLSQISIQYPELGTPDMAGLNPDIPTLRRVVGAFRPFLEQTLRDRYGVELLAVYIYPAQMLFCNRPLTGLSDLAGRRTRVSSSTQADFIQALNGTPVFTEFSELMSNMKSGNTECAVTGSMSGNTLGLHEITRYIYTMPLSWGLAVFAANRETWNTLPPDLKVLLRREMPKLETAVWAQSEHDTVEGVACNTGAPNCGWARKGNMLAVVPSVKDEARRREIFATQVLPGWVQRCGPICAQTWDRTVGPVIGIRAPSVQ